MASRSARERLARRAGATSPTWLARMVRRAEWKEPPRPSRTCVSPYQLRSTTVPSVASRSTASWSPADVALVCRTRSQPLDRAGGRPRPRRTGRPAQTPPSALVGSTSTSVTWAPGMPASRRATQHPTIPPPTTATLSPTRGAASQRALTAVSTVPASTARSGGTPSGTTATASTGTTNALWCGKRENTVRPSRCAGPSSTVPTFEVPVLHRPREVTVLERRPHRGILAGRHTALEDERLRAPAHAGVQGADAHLARARRRQLQRLDLARRGPHQPERARGTGHGPHPSRHRDEPC